MDGAIRNVNDLKVYRLAYQDATFRFLYVTSTMLWGLEKKREAG